MDDGKVRVFHIPVQHNVFAAPTGRPAFHPAETADTVRPGMWMI